MTLEQPAEFRVFIPVDDIRGLQVVVTDEGVIYDLFELGDHMETQAETFGEIADRLAAVRA